MRKRAIEVQLRYQRRIALQPVYAAQQSFPYFRKQLVFKADKVAFCARYLLFQFFQFFGNIALRISKRLLSYIAIRHQMLIRLGNFNIITEYSVIANSQVLYARGGAFARFYGGHHAFAVCGSLSKFIHFAVISGADNSAILHAYWRIVHYRIPQQRAYVLHRVKVFRYAAERFGFKRMRLFYHGGQLFKRYPQRYAVPPVHAAVSYAAAQPLNIVYIVKQTR